MEDMRANQKIMLQMLHKEQIDVEVAQNGLEGLNLFKVIIIVYKLVLEEENKLLRFHNNRFAYASDVWASYDS